LRFIWLQIIGAGASKFLGVQTIFAQIFPNLPKKLSCNFCQSFLWGDLQKWSSLVFLQTLGAIFRSQTPLGAIFPRVSGILPRYLGFCSDFQGFCKNFQRFCPDFQRIKTFGGALAPLAPPPPAPLLQMLWCCFRHLTETRF